MNINGWVGTKLTKGVQALRWWSAAVPFHGDKGAEILGAYHGGGEAGTRMGPHSTSTLSRGRIGTWVQCRGFRPVRCFLALRQA